MAMPIPQPIEVRRRAMAQLLAEEYEKAVDAEIARLRQRKTLWARLCSLAPFTITITRRKA